MIYVPFCFLRKEDVERGINKFYDREMLLLGVV
jgi:hypothetical protein